jgi:hypothetical protein
VSWIRATEPPARDTVTSIKKGRHARPRPQRRQNASGAAPVTVRPGRVTRVMRPGGPGNRAGVAITVGLIAAASALALAVLMWPDMVPHGAYAPLAVVAGLALGPRMLLTVYLAMGAWIAIVLERIPDRATLGEVAMLGIVMVLMLWLSRAKANLGVPGVGGERMLVDLRDRLQRMGELPVLPDGWRAERALKSAHGDAFSGDFLVTARSSDSTTFEVVIVDVSGKGLRAGTRSLLLSGAFSGLLGSTDAEGFLPAANTYLMRQSWPEGFATAIHLQICTRTGVYSVATAGHPPAVKYSAGSGRWTVVDEEGGPLLGVLESAKYPRTTGVLNRGDALLLYTDGVIESRNRHLADGIDRMLGTAERSVKSGFNGMADRICHTARGGESDDRAVVLVWRS